MKPNEGSIINLDLNITLAAQNTETQDSIKQLTEEKKESFNIC